MLGWKYTFYKLYHTLIALLGFSFVILRLANLALEALRGFESIEQFGLSVLVLPAHLNAMFKIINLSYNRHKLITIEKVFVSLGKSNERSQEARKRQTHYDQSCRYIIIFYKFYLKI